MRKIKFSILAVFVITATAKSQHGVFKYQYDNDRTKGGTFSFTCPDSSLNFIADASAGYLDASNNPYAQATKTMGPIPNGTWTVSSVKNPTKSILRLTPGNDVNIPYRDGFLIHGLGVNENAAESSNGCIILAQLYRQKLLAAFQKYGPFTLSVTNFTTSDQKGKS